MSHPFLGVRELEVDHRRRGRQLLCMDVTTNVPHQEAGIEVLLGHAVAYPALSPNPHGPNDWFELGASRGQPVLGRSPVLAALAFDDPVLF
jgi:hypothetical protein